MLISTTGWTRPLAHPASPAARREPSCEPVDCVLIGAREEVVAPTLPPHQGGLTPAALPAAGPEPPSTTESVLALLGTRDGWTQKGESLFAMHLDKPRAADALVAAGAALAQGVPSLYLVPDRSQLPWFLREADLVYPGQVAILEGPRPLGLEAAVHLLEPRSHQGSEKRVDTFIGCLMSGLTPEQYAEGQEHLRAIDRALGGEHNFCEGLAVASTDSFDRPRDSLAMDMEALQASRSCVFYQYDASHRPSGMWVELGAALALDKPCLLLTPDLGSIPPCLRQGAPNLTIRCYDSHEELLASLPFAVEPVQGHNRLPSLDYGP